MGLFSFLSKRVDILCQRWYNYDILKGGYNMLIDMIIALVFGMGMVKILQYINIEWTQMLVDVCGYSIMIFIFMFILWLIAASVVELLEWLVKRYL